MSLLRSHLWIACLLLASTAYSQPSQNYPVQTNAYVAAPFSQRLADYFSSDKRLLIDLLLKDITKPSIQVYLKWRIEGVGIRVQSRETYLPPAFITLQRGLLTRLRGSELQANYFNPAAIETQGLDPRSVYTIELPEGFYTLNVQAIEAATGQVVSNQSETYLVLAYPQPPMLNLPLAGSEVPVTSLQKVPLSWVPRHFATPTTQAVYQLQVCEVPEAFDPTELVMLTCTEPRLAITVPTTSYAPDITQWIKPLEVGKRYAVQVTVSDLSGELTNFVNQGRSQVSWFRYGTACSPPVFTVQSLGSDRLHLSWERVTGSLGYVVEYKLATGTEWQGVSSLGTSQVIGGLNPALDYLFRMRSDCGGVDLSPASAVQPWNIGDRAPSLPPSLPVALTDPGGIGVQAGADGQPQMPTSLSALYANFPPPTNSPTALSPPATGASGRGTALGTGASLLVSPQRRLPFCAASASSFAGCEQPHPVVGLPTGEKELTSLSMGDVLGLYDYAVFVTKVGTTDSRWSGEGLVRLPFLNGTMALVEFSGVSAKAGEEGTSGGCVYAIGSEGQSVPGSSMPGTSTGYFRIKRSGQAEVMAAQENLIRQLVNPPGSLSAVFVGNLAQALTKYDSTVVANGLTQPGSQTLSTATNQTLIQYVSAIGQGSQVLKEKFEGVYGTSTDPLVISIRDSLDVLLGQVSGVLTSMQSSTSVVGPLPLLVNRYEALFEQLGKLTNPAQPPVSLPAVYSIRNVTLSNVSTTSAGINWQGDPAFTKYVVTYQIQNSSPMTQTVSDPQLVLKNLKAGTNYTFSIQAYQNNESLSSYGPAIFATLPLILPSPENVAYTINDNNGVTITWDKNKEHLRYKLAYKGTDGIERFLYPTTNQVTLKDLIPGQQYTYDIVAYGTDNSQSEARAGAVDLASCSITLSTLKRTVVEGDSLILTAGGCPGGTLIWNTGETDVRQLTVSPTTETTYFVNCQLPNSVSNSICSAFIDIAVEPEACGGFAVSPSKATINQGDKVSLTAKGCQGELAWHNALGSAQEITVYPNTNTVFKANCQLADGSICVASTEVKVNCSLLISIKPYYYDPGWFSKTRRGLVATAICNGKLESFTYSPTDKATEDIYQYGDQGQTIVFEKRAGRLNLTGVKGDITFSAKCQTGTDRCVQEITVKKPSCGDFSISATQTTDQLVLTGNGCSEGDLIHWENASDGLNLRVPTPVRTTQFKATCGHNGCEAYYTFYPSIYQNAITVAPIGYGQTLLGESGCNGGRVTWSSDPEAKFVVTNQLNSGDYSPIIAIPAQLPQTTTYIATCKMPGNRISAGVVYCVGRV